MKNLIKIILLILGLGLIISFTNSFANSKSSEVTNKYRHDISISYGSYHEDVTYLPGGAEDIIRTKYFSGSVGFYIINNSNDEINSYDSFRSYLYEYCSSNNLDSYKIVSTSGSFGKLPDNAPSNSIYYEQALDESYLIFDMSDYSIKHYDNEDNYLSTLYPNQTLEDGYYIYSAIYSDSVSFVEE
ncbi:MAG: hypothetical protein K6E87_04545 [bacterium]|nr:hypothetical protein [bacterium]